MKGGRGMGSAATAGKRLGAVGGATAAATADGSQTAPMPRRVLPESLPAVPAPPRGSAPPSRGSPRAEPMSKSAGATPVLPSRFGRRFGVDGVDSALEGGGGASSSSPPPTARFGWSARERSSPEPATSACSSTDASPKAAVRFAEPHRPAAQKPGGLPSPRAAPRSGGESDAAAASQQPLFTQLLPRGGLGLDGPRREKRVSSDSK
jgi:hypothetical protein